MPVRARDGSADYDPTSCEVHADEVERQDRDALRCHRSAPKRPRVEVVVHAQCCVVWFQGWVRQRVG